MYLIYVECYINILGFAFKIEKIIGSPLLKTRVLGCQSYNLGSFDDKSVVAKL